MDAHWPEIDIVRKENRREIVLSGPAISERIDAKGLDPQIFNLVVLNYLNIHDTSLTEVPHEISLLRNLQTLILHTNKISKVSPNIGTLQKLKVLDLYRNELTRVPDEISNLAQLNSLNISSNHLETFPKMFNNTKLHVLDLSNNCLKQFPDICYPEMSNVTDLKLHLNKIEEIPSDIKNLGSLKTFDISGNKVSVVPGELADCTKLKELNLKGNSLTDRRFVKLIEQCRTKQVLDYIKQNIKLDTKSSKKGGKKGKGAKDGIENIEVEVEDDDRLKIRVAHCKEGTVRVIVTEEVKKVRGYILCCLLRDLSFTEESFKKFIQLQTRLHDDLCEKRNAATIATHDSSKIGSGNLTYSVLEPKKLMIQPLGRPAIMSGIELFTQLQLEANNYRKEKKRNVYSGIHKYLYLLEGQKMYACILNIDGDVISFPPITNSELTKISLDTKNIFIEVTSAISYGVCKKVLDTLIWESVQIFGTDVIVEQIKNIDMEGNMRSIYPSKMDLVYEDTKIGVVRE